MSACWTTSRFRSPTTRARPRSNDAVLACLCLEPRKQRDGAIGYGPATRAAPFLDPAALGRGQRRARAWGFTSASKPPNAPPSTHFIAPVSPWAAKTLVRPGYARSTRSPYYGAFLLDHDGFKVEAVCRRHAT